MKAWFAGLEPRERQLVSGGAAVLLLLLLYTMIWDPMVGSYRDLKKDVAEQAQTLAWMQQTAGQIKALQRSSGGGGAQGLGGRSLLSVVDQSARTGGLGNSIKRIEPDGGKGVKIWLEGVAFDPMILWLGKLTRTYQIETSLITIEPQGGGRVNARLTLLEPAV
ncbi:MAG TPA: type II secretion system protein M [Gammaproteobacteria bacterium]|nr:type II secretion system protein M [Gammaproteobacteria bacterium]